MTDLKDLKIADLRRLAVAPGDRLILQTEVPLSQAQHAALINAWKAWTAPLVVPLLVLPRDFKITAVSAEDLERAGQVAELSHG